MYGSSLDTKIRSDTYDDISIRIEELPDMLNPCANDVYYSEEDFIFSPEDIGQIRESMTTEEICAIDRNCNDEEVFEILSRHGVLDRIAINLIPRYVENPKLLYNINIGVSGSNVRIRYTSSVIQDQYKN